MDKMRIDISFGLQNQPKRPIRLQPGVYATYMSVLGQLIQTII